MIFDATAVAGAFVVRSEPVHDERGAFVRLYDAEAFGTAGLATEFPEHSLSSNGQRGTVRGLHLQSAPYGEAKLVRCTRGALYDVVVDLRRCSPSYLRWHAVELRAGDGQALYLPVGCAHGFQTLEDDTDVLYLISERYHPEAAGGVRYDDPALGVDWPLPPSRISERDLGLPRLRS